MDQTLLRQKVNDWKKACEYFSSPGVQKMLATEERDAIAFLVDFWRTQEYNKSACEARIEILKQCDKLHASNREIIEKSKMLRGLAQTFYTKDIETFKEFRTAMGYTPTPTPKQTPTPQQNSVPEHDAALMLITAEKWTKAFQFLKSEDIIPLLDNAELTAIELLGDMWRRPRFTPSIKQEAKECIDLLVASHKLHASNREIIEHIKNLCGVARKVYDNEQAFTAFKTFISKYFKENKPPRRETPTPTPTPTPIPRKKPTPTPTQQDSVLVVSNVIFANSSKNGTVLSNFGKILYTTTQYIKPKLIVTSNFYGSREIVVELKCSDGNVYTYRDTIEFSGRGEYEISGWGNESGSAFSGIRHIEYTIITGGRMLWSGRLNFEPDPNLPKVPTISNVVFGATDFDGNILIDFGNPLPTGIPYLAPRITVSNNYTGTIKLDVILEYSNKPTERYSSEVRINGAGSYNIASWGNKQRTAYSEDQTIRVSIAYRGTTLYTTTVKIGSGGRTPKQQRQSFTPPTPTNSESRWARFSDAISRIGDWLDDHTDIISGIIMVIIGIIYVIAVISTWINDGFLSALIAGVIGGIIAYLAVIAMTIVTNVVLWVLKLIFKNGWTFLIVAIALSYIIVIEPAYYLLTKDRGFNDDTYTENSYTESTTTTYRCTAASLNIRQAPNGSSRVIGSLQKGDKVEVYDISNGFAHIKYFGNDAYVSTKYLEIVY